MTLSRRSAPGSLRRLAKRCFICQQHMFLVGSEAVGAGARRHDSLERIAGHVGPCRRADQCLCIEFSPNDRGRTAGLGPGITLSPSHCLNGNLRSYMTRLKGL